MSPRTKAILVNNKHQKWRLKRSKEQDGRCYWCGVTMNEPEEVGKRPGATPTRICTLDHFVPVSLGGADHWENAVSACKRCNRNKDNTHPSELTPFVDFQANYDARLAASGSENENSSHPAV